jgi:hypothetical protein
VADSVLAGILICVIFLIGVACGVLIVVVVRAYRKGDGPGPRGGGRGSTSG